jgi:hypothetical protein
MFRIKLFILSLLIIVSSVLPCFANICEEDAAKMAMSHCFKNFSDLYQSPGVKVRVEKVELFKINGINGPIEFFNVVISKYHKQTLVKINDFLLYEIEKQNAIIVTIKNIEDDNSCLKASAYKLFRDGGLASLKSVNYEKYANIINLCGDLILSAINEESDKSVKERVLNNIDTVIAGIGLYKPELSYKIAEFEQGLKSLRTIQ